MKALSLNQPLASVLWTGKINPLMRRTLLVLGGTLLIAIGAHCVVPLHPVPVTLQTLAVLFIAMTYGWRLAIATIVLYFIEGVVLGLPVFAEGYVGFSIIFDSTIGYFLGWFPAAFVSGFLIQRGWGRNYIGVILAGLLGTAPIFICGLAVLSCFIGFSGAIAVGLKPFLLADTLKIIFLAVVIPVFWHARDNAGQTDKISYW